MFRNPTACPNVLIHSKQYARNPAVFCFIRVTNIMSISQPLHTSHSHSAQPVIGPLLVHGFNDSRDDMAEQPRILITHDIVTVTMLSPGHGQRLQALFSVAVADCAP